MSNIDSSVELKVLEENKDNKKFSITLKLPMNMGWIDDVFIIIRDDNDENYYRLNHQKNKDGYAFFSGEVTLNTKALYHYYFSCFANGEKKYILKADDELWKLSVNYDVPDWAKGKIIYHIFVDRFNRDHSVKIKEMDRRYIHENWSDEVIIEPDENGIWNNDFFGGNLKGIINKLDYIKELGVSILYLSPIVYSQSTHRYDTSDYEQVDPYLGTNDDLKLLCDEAHKRGMKVILDAVFNHTGNDSKYFNEYNTFDTVGAYQSSDSPYYDFYKHNNGKFEYWWGMTNLPVCDGNSKHWQEYITGPGGIIDLWFGLGIDGLRLDVADDLTDEFIELIRNAVVRNKNDGFILGEVWENPMRQKRGYLSSGKGMHTVMNYNFMSSIIKYIRYGDITDLSNKIKEIKYEYPDDAIFSAMNFTSTHDMTRGINLWDELIFKYYGEWPWNLINESSEFCKQYKLTKEQYEEIKKIYMVYVFFLTFLPGNLSLFYGDEVGLQGIGNLKNRAPFPWKNKDEKLLEFFKFIGRIRNNETFMETADFKIKDLNVNYIAFERIKDNNKILVVVNRTGMEQQIVIPDEYKDKQITYSLKNNTANCLYPYGGFAIKLKNN